LRGDAQRTLFKQPSQKLLLKTETEPSDKTKQENLALCNAISPNSFVLPCPPGKNSYARHFKGKHGKLYKINVDFGKKYELPVFLIPQKIIAKMTAK